MAGGKEGLKFGGRGDRQTAGTVPAGRGTGGNFRVPFVVGTIKAVRAQKVCLGDFCT